MSQQGIVLIGAGGHAEACIDVIEEEGRFVVVGLVGEPHEKGSNVLGYAVVGSDDDLPALLKDVPNALIAVGQIKSPDTRIRLFDRARELGANTPVIVSPRAHVSRHATVGAGTIVMHGAVVNPGSTVGRNCIVNSQALIEHGVYIGDHCHIATHAAVNSGVRIGGGTFVGSGSTIRQCVTIGDRCVIGMGQRILLDCADGTWIPERKRLT